MSVDRWYPIRSRISYDRPAPGTLVALRREVWRVVETRDVPEIDREDGDTQDAYYVILVPHRGGKRRHVKARRRISWHVMDEHFPVCVECGEPYPCLHLDAKAAGERAGARLDKLASILPGCCWGCGEPITARQERMSFAGPNVWLPTAPDSPAFHLRRACYGSAVAYEDAWVTADPTRPRSLLTLKCQGTVVVHHGGDAECFGAVDSDCPTVYARHRAYTACFAQTHGCPRDCPREGHPGAALRRPKGLLIPSSESELR